MCDNFWQPYATPFQTRYNAPQQAFGSKFEVIRVNGKNGAEAFQMPPNSSIILLDESAPLIWLKMTDGAGYPTIQYIRRQRVSDGYQWQRRRRCLEHYE